MNVLGIETSGQLCRVAVVGDSLSPVERYELVGNAFSETLFDLANDVLLNAGISKSELNGVAVCIGPGSFNGIRVGVSAAKGIAHSLSAALVGVTVFETLAYSVDSVRFPLCCIVPMKADKAAYIIIENDVNVPQFRSFRTGTWEKVIQDIINARTVCGDLMQELVAYLREKLPETVSVVPCSVSAMRIAEIGLGKLKLGISDDVINLTPIYAFTTEFREKTSMF